MKSFVLVSGPRDAGPGEREVMLARAMAALEQLEVEDITRIDVPGRGSGDEQSDAGLRLPVQSLIPALQSGSLFGDRVGVLVVDAHSLLKAEAEVIAEVIDVADEAAVAAVFVAAGTVPAPLGKTLKARAEQISIRRPHRTLRSRLAGDRGPGTPSPTRRWCRRCSGQDVRHRRWFPGSGARPARNRPRCRLRGRDC